LLENEIGRYVDHDISHPVIAMYGMSKEENNDLLERLAQTAEWQKIEEERDSDNRRPGSNSYFTHINGELKEFRSLNFLDYRGYSEDRIARLGSAWREEARGSKTRFR